MQTHHRRVGHPLQRLDLQRRRLRLRAPVQQLVQLAGLNKWEREVHQVRLNLALLLLARVAMIGGLPVKTSSITTPKLYTSVAGVRRPVRQYSGSM